MLHNLTKKRIMKKRIKILSIVAIIIPAFFIGCQEEDYNLGDLTTPTNLVINTEIVGQNATNPYGDGSGNVNITATANNALAYKIAYKDVTDLSSPIEFSNMLKGIATKKFTTLGEHTYRITVIAYGTGGASTVATKDITVVSNFNPEAYIVTALTNDSSKSWVVDKSVPGHFGVGPWNEGSYTPEWWSAAINEKVACCNCFYTATFTFVKNTSSNTFSLNVATPDGAFTKTGSLASIPGIPASGDEGCYNYGGGSSAFSFIPSSVNPTNSSITTTHTSIMLGGTTTFIGYGALQKEFEILEINANYMYLRVQGTETGNAWYLKLKPAN